MNCKYDLKCESVKILGFNLYVYILFYKKREKRNIKLNIFNFSLLGYGFKLYGYF